MKGAGRGINPICESLAPTGVTWILSGLLEAPLAYGRGRTVRVGRKGSMTDEVMAEDQLLRDSVERLCEEHELDFPVEE